MVAPQEPFAATVYLIVTVVFEETSAGLYVEPLIEPPPVTMLGVPFPDIVFVLVSQIAAVVVVLLAVPGSEFTVKSTLALLALQAPFLAMV